MSAVNAANDGDTPPIAAPAPTLASSAQAGDQELYYLLHLDGDGYDTCHGPMTEAEYDHLLNQMGSPTGDYQPYEEIAGICVTLHPDGTFQRLTAWGDAPNEEEEEEEEEECQ